MNQIKNPRLMMISAMAIFGTLGLFVRKIPVFSGELALYRACLAAVLLGAFLLLTRQPIPVSKIRRELPLLLLSGVAVGINWILLFEAYKYTTGSPPCGRCFSTRSLPGGRSCAFSCPPWGWC